MTCWSTSCHSVRFASILSNEKPLTSIQSPCIAPSIRLKLSSLRLHVSIIVFTAIFHFIKIELGIVRIKMAIFFIFNWRFRLMRALNFCKMERRGLTTATFVKLFSSILKWTATLHITITEFSRTLLVHVGLLSWKLASLDGKVILLGKLTLLNWTWLTVPASRSRVVIDKRAWRSRELAFGKQFGLLSRIRLAFLREIAVAFALSS